MKCAVHTDRDATGFCRNCGKAMCPECVREVKGALYCEDCLAGLLGSVPGKTVATTPLGSSVVVVGATPAVVPQGPNPGLACALGFIPGLGAVVNGEYTKAIIHVLIFAALIGLLSSDLPGGYDAFLGVLLAVFYLYMPIDAYRTAAAKRAGEAAPGLFGAQAKADLPVGALVLIVLGVLLLLSNFGLLREEWLGAVWPAGLIALGGWLLWRRMRGPS
jgi:hypothetical protein